LESWPGLLNRHIHALFALGTARKTWMTIGKNALESTICRTVRWDG
jgi:hypothetical protein